MEYLTESVRKLILHVISGSSTLTRHIKEATQILNELYENCKHFNPFEQTSLTKEELEIRDSYRALLGVNSISMSVTNS